jgi:hypothetical protein
MDLTLSSTDIGIPPLFQAQNLRSLLAQKPPFAESAGRPQTDILSNDVSKKIFSYEEAAALMPRVQRITSEAVAVVEDLSEDTPPERYDDVVQRWAADVMGLGIEVKGLWLVDFDNGSGYYCWKHPETSLQYFHGYEEGFTGRVKLQ